MKARSLLLLCVCVLCGRCPGGEPNAARASLVAEGKLVLAHYMTKMAPCADGEPMWASPELHDPAGSTAALGGLYLTLPMWAVLRPAMSLEEAVDFEIRCARRMGVDGFQFYYPFFKTAPPLRDYNRIVSVFVRIAALRHPGFKVTLCLSLGGQFPEMKEAQRVEIWGAALQELLDQTASSPAWLRTRSGSLLFYHWASDGFADGVGHVAGTPQQVEKVAAAFGRLAVRSGHAIDWVFHVRRTQDDPPYIDAVLRRFPAVWGWVEADDDPAFWDRLAKRCAEQGVAYTQTVYPDYFTSKVYRRGDEHYQLLSVQDALRLGAQGIERHYRQTDLARGQVRLLQSAIDRGAQIINYATWNDWPEGQHLAPEANHNFGPSLLLRHFAAKWRGQPPPFQDLAMVFFKKHPSTAAPPRPIAVKVKSRRNEPAAEDEVQLVTVLTDPARCEFNGRDAGPVAAGFHVTAIPLPQEGPMRIRLLRVGDGKAIVDFTTPLGVTRRPSRVDRLTFSYSSNFPEEFHALFGAAKPPLPASSAAVPGPADQTARWVLPAIRAPRLQHGTFESTATKTKVSYFIYTPEIYDTERERRFPVLYWLHGTGGGLPGVRPLAAHFDAAIRAGKTPPMIVVFANGLATSMWCDSKDASVPMETVVVKELLPHVDATFRTIATRQGRLVEGFSMGGYGAARLGFKHHKLFAAVSILAGGPLDLEFKGPRATANPEEREHILRTVFGGDLEYFEAQSPWVLAEQNASAVRGKTRVRMVTGERDFTLGLNRRFSAHLKQLNIPHTFTVPPGAGHDTMALLDALGEENWQFYRAALGEDRARK